MNLIQSWFGGPLWRELIWVLVHSLWLGVVVALAVWGLLRRLDGRRPQVRYLVALAGLAALVLLPPVAVSFFDARGRSMAAPAAAAVAGGAPRVWVAEPAAQPRPQWPSPSTAAIGRPTARPDWTAWAAAAWLLGAAAMLVRMAAEQTAARRLLRLPALPEDHVLAKTAGELSRRLGLRRAVRIAIADSLLSPAVAGLLRPVILVPTVALTGLTLQQWRVVLAHELAHIRRHDAWVKLAQRLVESLLFFNPAAWWLSRQVRLEREACCDLLAAQATDGHLAVAQTLAQAAASFRAPAAALALADGPRGTLLQRVQRLLKPEGHIPVRLPWPTFVALTLLCALVLAGAGVGATAVGRAAAKWLTPEEHIKQVTQIREQYAQPVVDPQAKASKITIDGRIRTDDGSALPGRVGLTIHTEYVSSGGTQTGEAVGYSNQVKPDGTFSVQVTAGSIFLVADAEDYAPAIAKGLKAKPGDKIADVELVLSRGFSAQVRVVDEEGQPLPGIAADAAIIGNGQWLRQMKTTADAEGILHPAHLGPGTLRLETRTAGFQHDVQSFELEPNQTATWKLHRAHVVRGMVADKETDQSIPQAKIYLAAQQGFENPGYDIRHDYQKNAPLLAASDAAGQFTLDTLRDDCQYDLWVDVTGRGTQLVRGVSAKQETLRVQFQPTVIEGRIKGDSSKLERRNGKPTITVDNSVKLGHMISGGGFHVPVSLEGDVARFEIANIVPGSVDLTAGGRETHLDVRQSVRGLVIDLDAPAQTQPQYATRKVTIRLVPPEGWPAPSGTIRTDYVHPGRESSYQYRVTKVTDGQATVEVALPASGSGKMLCNALEVPGYWFDERNGISVPPGEEPMVLEIPVQPAGAVFGTVLAADGSPAEHFNATVIVVKPAEKGPRFGLQSQNGSADGRFVIGGLGLGGVYRVMIGDDRTDSRLVSEEFTLDRATPTYELKLRFAEGITLEATVLGLDGQPRSGVEVSLNCETSWNHSFGGTVLRIDSAGHVRWNHINFDLPATYSLEVFPAGDTQGQTVPVKADQNPLTIRPVAGRATSGTVMDGDTGKPVPGALMRLNPATYGDGRYGGTIEVTTDNQGRFQIDCLDGGQYSVYGEQFLWDGSGLKVTGGAQDQVLTVKLRPERN